MHGSDRGLHLAQLQALTPQLHLTIRPAQIIQLPTMPQCPIPGIVYLFARIIRVWAESLRR